MSNLQNKLSDLENAMEEIPEIPDINYRKLQGRARQLAAKSIQSFIKDLLHRKYSASGLKTDKGRIVELIDQVKVFYSSKKGVVIGLIDGLPEQRYKQFMALNSGAVHSKSGAPIKYAAKGKKKFKEGAFKVANESTNSGNYRVQKAYKFFDFTESEKQQIEQRFLAAFQRIFERMISNG
jgi:hypothetical protein